MHASQTSTDAAVIRASRLEPAAFGIVFDRHWVRIHRYCVVRAGPPGEDVAAETFRVAFDRRADYDGRADASPWLYGIATNVDGSEDSHADEALAVAERTVAAEVR